MPPVGALPPRATALGGPWTSPSRWRANPWVVDAALVVGLLLLLVASAPGVDDPDAADPGGLGGAGAWVLRVALVLPLAFRRRAPLAVFLVVTGVALVQWLAGPALYGDPGPELYGDSGLLVAMYTVAAHGRHPRDTRVVAGLAAAGSVVVVLRWATDTPMTPALTLVIAATMALPVAVGFAVRARRAALVVAEENAARAERGRIAGEMHDVVAHHLSVMVALADGARMTVARDPAQAADAIAQVATTGRDALTEMRGLLGVLHEGDDDAPRRPQPGLHDLPELVDAVRGADLEVSLEVEAGLVGGGEDAAGEVPAGVALTVHRVVQEALTNVLKHGRGVGAAAVVVRRAGDGIAVEVRDDGAGGSDGGGAAVRAGCDRDQPVGRGLDGMAARVTTHGGTVQAGSDPWGGWTVRALIPLGRSTAR